VARVIALAGGVGGAKLAYGLAASLSPEDLTVIVNVGDDFTHLGFPVCPDIDTVLYTLAGIANRETGWGIAGETWSFMEAVGRLGGETWFRLGDRDIATHVLRRQLLDEGKSLTEATDELRRRQGIGCRVIPATDDRLRTIVQTDRGEMDFQSYFVRDRCEPVVQSLRYDGADTARPSLLKGRAWTDADIDGIVICPSNPYLSVAPMLAIPAAQNWLRNRHCPAVAVSPIIGGQAVKGPAAKLMREFGKDASVLTVAHYYRGLIDVLLIDSQDAGEAESVAVMGIRPVICDIMMRSDAERRQLAATCIDLLAEGQIG
jgi:LPPG:FO 2-phospho-L-lactate transferase